MHDPANKDLAHVLNAGRHGKVAGFMATDRDWIKRASEMGYTNLLTALDLAGIPLHATDRTDGPFSCLRCGQYAWWDEPEPVPQAG